MKKMLLLIISFIAMAGIQLSGQLVIFYEQNFEGAWPADGIASPDMGDPGGYYWQIGNAATWSSTNYTIPDHTNFMVLNDDGWDGANDYSYATPTPYLLMPDEDNLKLTFDIYYLAGTYAGLYEVAELYLYDNTTFTLVELPFSGNPDAWQSLEYDMSAYRGHEIYFSITYFDQGSWMYGIAVDNFKFSYEIPLAPVEVTYQVDITNYLAEGNVLAAGGIRIAGNFADYGATAGGSPMVNWVPTDPSSAMDYLGGNIYSIDVMYPGEAAGLTQYYKFVNGDWGANEGTDPENTIATDGCGVDDGGNINRTLVIPALDATYKYCWDHCGPNCPEIIAINNTTLNANVSIYPNPSDTYISVKYVMSSAENVNIEISDVSGRVIRSIQNVSSANGDNFYNMDVRNMSSGVYYVHINAENSNYSGSFVVL